MTVFSLSRTFVVLQVDRLLAVLTVMFFFPMMIKLWRLFYVLAVPAAEHKM